MNIFRRIISRFSLSPRVVDPRDDRPTIDMLTAKYNEAVDIMNQQTAALLASCGVLETWTGDMHVDYDTAVSALNLCRAAVAGESFPTP